MLYVKDYISIPDRAILKKDAKLLLEAMDKSFTKKKKVELSFQDVPYLVNIFISESIGSFLYGLSPDSFVGRATYANCLTFYDYQSEIQEFKIKEALRHYTDKAYHESYIKAFIEYMGE